MKSLQDIADFASAHGTGALSFRLSGEQIMPPYDFLENAA
jgi:hypothetical protein